MMMSSIVMLMILIILTFVMFPFKKIFKNKKHYIKIIVATDENMGIGKNGKLLFSIKEDMQHFTKKTTGGVVIMGSNTYFSIPEKFRPLKNRINILLSKKERKLPQDVLWAKNIEESLRLAKKTKKEIWIIGGSNIYKQMLPFTDEIELTQVFSKKDADTFFPEFKNDFYLIKKSKKYYDKKENVYYQFQTWKRKEKNRK